MSEPIAPPDVPPIPPLVRSRHDPAATRRRRAERMGRLAASSLTVAEFCAAEGVSVISVAQRTSCQTSSFPVEPSERRPVRSSHRCRPAIRWRNSSNGW